MTTEIKEILAFVITWLFIGLVILVWSWLICRANNKQYRQGIRGYDKMMIMDVLGFRAYIILSVSLSVLLVGIYIFDFIFYLILRLLR